MMIAAFDVATISGCADGQVGDQKPRLFSWHLDDNGGGLAARLAHLSRFADRYFESVKPDIVVYEKPMPIAVMLSIRERSKFVTSESAVLFLRASIGVLICRAAIAGIPEDRIRGVDIKSARGHLCGQRTFPAGTAKGATMRAAAALGWAPENDNEADAAALWSLACGQENPRIAAALGRAHHAAKDVSIRARAKDKVKGDGPLFK